MIDFGQGVTLGPVNSFHGETMRAWRNDVRVRSWCRQVGVISDTEQIRWMNGLGTDPAIRMFSVVDPVGTFVGVAGLTSIDLVNSRAEFSLYIAPSEQGRGLGKHALKTLCLFGFEELGLNSIWGESFDGNPAIKIFTDVGFVKEGVRRDFYFKGGVFVDAVLVSIQRHELKL